MLPSAVERRSASQKSRNGSAPSPLSRTLLLPVPRPRSYHHRQEARAGSGSSSARLRPPAVAGYTKSGRPLPLPVTSRLERTGYGGARRDDAAAPSTICAASGGTLMFGCILCSSSSRPHRHDVPTPIVRVILPIVAPARSAPSRTPRKWKRPLVGRILRCARRRSGTGSQLSLE